jgi:hypothetical protein
MTFPVPFVVANPAVQRRSSENSNVFFGKLLYPLTSSLSLAQTLTKKLLFLMEVILVVLRSLLPGASNGGVTTYLSFIFKMTYKGTLAWPSAVSTAVYHSFVYPRKCHSTSLDAVACGLHNIYDALQACENLRTPLCRSYNKRIFTNFGKVPRYACVGPQVSRNSQKVHHHPPFMDQLSSQHWESLLWLMRRAEECFKTISDHQVISHIHHAKKVVPFKTFTTTNPNSTSLKFFGGIAFGTNVFL